MKTIPYILILNFILISSCNTTEVPIDDIGDTEPDTTSQNFTFEFYEFGDGFESSYLNDVCVFDENNIWAAGWVGPSDTINGVYITNPNIIKWDGVKWEIQPYSGTTSGIDGMWALDNNLIYFATGNILKYQNNKYEDIVVKGNWTQGQSIAKLWGSSENNIYGVGPCGTFVYYNGVQWTKIDFDNQWYFYEVTGNKETGVAYAVARNHRDDCIVVKLDKLSQEIIYQKSKSELEIASWTITESNNFLYLVSSDLSSTKFCRLSYEGEVEILHEVDPHIGVKTSHAFNQNDIFYFGDEGSEARLIHYNGIRSKIFNLPQIDPDNYGAIHAIKDLAVSVGFANNKAYLIKITR